LLQSAGKSRTPRTIATFGFKLKRISGNFCSPDGFCQDSRQYIGDLLNWKDRMIKIPATVLYIVAADVKGLYPSLYGDAMTKALECALDKHSIFNK